MAKSTQNDVAENQVKLDLADKPVTTESKPEKKVSTTKATTAKKTGTTKSASTKKVADKPATQKTATQASQKPKTTQKPKVEKVENPVAVEEPVVKEEVDNSKKKSKSEVEEIRKPRILTPEEVNPKLKKEKEKEAKLAKIERRTLT